MCQAIRELMEDARNEGIEQGIEQERECGVRAVIESLQECGLSKESVLQKVDTKFNLGEERARAALERYWKL